VELERRVELSSSRQSIELRRIGYPMQVTSEILNGQVSGLSLAARERLPQPGSYKSATEKHQDD
jgi:hypothetical protein